MQAQARRDGYFKTRMGRIRRVDFWYNSPERSQRSFADRTVSNGLVQGLCGDIIRVALTRIWNDVIRNPKWYDKHVFWVCTVHDEIALSVDKSPDLFEEITQEVLKRMLDFPILNFKVPLSASPSVGLNWGHVFDFHRDEKGVWVPGKAPKSKV
jgi:DNA polymerase I-like protein with 3'-5' exonuclease and polymerase domains